MMIVAMADHITLTDLELRAYEQALEPKQPTGCGFSR